MSGALDIRGEATSQRGGDIFTGDKYFGGNDSFGVRQSDFLLSQNIKTLGIVAGVTVVAVVLIKQFGGGK